MAENGGGSMVFTSSVIAAQSFPYMSGYCAGKAGWRPSSARLQTNSAISGSGSTASVRGWSPRPTTRRSRRAFPVSGRRLSSSRRRCAASGPDDIAGAIRYLAGPESSWVTGTAITVDGGAHMRRAPDIHQRLRDEHGDRAVDELLQGRIPTDAGMPG
ncbi:SDR family oxidoreductase [Prescottella defluvii]|nr:SDR family oxidoreductase [Prescottella defluvii]